MGYMINGLCMNETDGCRFIKWRTLSDFECNAKKGMLSGFFVNAASVIKVLFLTSMNLNFI